MWAYNTNAVKQLHKIIDHSKYNPYKYINTINVCFRGAAVHESKLN